MRNLLIIVIALVTALPLTAQTRKTTRKSSTTKTATTQRRSSGNATQQKNTKKKSTATTSKKSSASKKKSANSTQTTIYTNSSIRGLQNQRNQVRQQIKKQEQALRANQADVKKRLRDLMVINTEIGERQKNIENIQKDITSIEGNIGLLRAQLATLEKQLQERKAKYVRSMQYIGRRHSIQEQLMFIFSADDLVQMYRRMRFAQEYAAYQRVQGEAIKSKQAQVNDKHRQLEAVRGQKHTLLSKGEKERTELEGKQSEQQKVVASLQKQQKTIRKVIDDQKKKDAALNAEIDKLIAAEVEKARLRAAAEAKKKAEAAAAAKKRAEELKRKREAAEAAARERDRQIKLAREREEKLKAEAREAAKRDDAAKERAEQLAREAEADRKAAELKNKVETERDRKEIAEARKDVEESERMSSVDRMLSGGFAANKGRLPMPITGRYRVVSHYGQYNVEGLKGVTLDNKGINILGSAGAAARSIYDGEVSAVFGYAGSMVVMVRHGSYISVYCNLRSVSVSKGQKVATRQALGTVGQDNILQFQLRNGMTKLNPEAWLAR